MSKDEFPPLGQGHSVLYKLYVYNSVCQYNNQKQKNVATSPLVELGFIHIFLGYFKVKLW